MTRVQHWLYSIQRWFDSEAHSDQLDRQSRSFNLVRVLPFVALHLACLLAFFTGVSGFALAFAVGFFLVRMFAITGFYHRYFSHKTFKTSRGWQLVFAIMGSSAAQRGPLWWAAHHRHHHQHSDEPEDLHSPQHGGFWWSHIGWFTCDAGFAMNEKRVGDWLRYPELRFINRFDALVPASCLALIYLLGEALALWAPGLGTNGPQLVVWGFFISTVMLFHATVSINSLAHVWGSRRFATEDDSRNNFWLALITLGEGWHNNHHRWPRSARQGFRWYEIDVTYYVLWLMEKAGIIHDLNRLPEEVRQEAIDIDQGRRREREAV